jgi:hypothetical protein
MHEYRESLMTLRLTVRSTADSSAGQISVEPRALILGGFSARSIEANERHIVELRTLGIEPPAQVPAFWHMSPWLLTTGSQIEVQGASTSGEIEYALIAHDGRTYVAVASDQTDREFERHSIPRSKQLCQKVLSAEVIPLDELLDDWHDIEIASEVSTDGVAWRPYQRDRLATMLDPRALVRACSGTDDLPDGTILLSGTISLIDGVTRYEPLFRGTLIVPGSDTVLRLAYRVDVLPEITTTKETIGA